MPGAEPLGAPKKSILCPAQPNRLSEILYIMSFATVSSTAVCNV